MRGRLTKALRSLHAVAVENPVHPGTPDINYSEGWIEAKWLRAWPRKPETVVTVDFNAGPNGWSSTAIPPPKY